MEAKQGVGLLVEGQEQPFGVEPPLGASLGQISCRPATLLGMRRECRVVDPQQFGVVRSAGIAADAYPIGNGRLGDAVQRASHLNEFANRHQTRC